MSLGEAVGMVAPYYNLALVIIVLFLFAKLFSFNSKKFAYIKPWKLLLIALIIFVVETAMTILRGLAIISFHPAIFPAFEMIMITLFIYMILLQKQYAKTGKKD
jgi:hypothetical protein